MSSLPVQPLPSPGPVLSQLHRLFQGIVPNLISTCSKDGTPNITLISQVFYVDASHVAVSCQFFNKTKRNLLGNPYACVELWDPVTFEAYRLGLRYLRSETGGPLFTAMSNRIDAIASHTGMAGIFKLRSADVCEVLWLRKVEGFMETMETCEQAGHDGRAVTDGPLTELRALNIVSARVNRARDLESLLQGALESLDELFRFRHSMVLLHEEACAKLVAIASHGYGESGVGAEVQVGAGLVGTAAATRAPMRLTGIDAQLRYSRAIRGSFEAVHGPADLRPEIPLPGLRDAAAQIALPLLVEDRLIGVLVIESHDPLAFTEWHEDFLQVLANQIAIGIDRFAESPDEEPHGGPSGTAQEETAPAGARSFVYYRGDDCVFTNGEYLVRNVPGKILWKLLNEYRRGRREFTNRELRLDASLGLPAFKDNLESRLILLRKRLEERCPDVRLVPLRRGRFALEVRCALELEERDAS